MQFNLYAHELNNYHLLKNLSFGIDVIKLLDICY